MDRATTTVRRLSALAGWSALIFIVFATLSPLSERPHIVLLGPDIERFVAYFCLAAALTIAYPAHRLPILLGIAAVAIGLEAAQAYEPTRHGRQHDAAIKIAGAMAGTLLVPLATGLARRLRRRL